MKEGIKRLIKEYKEEIEVLLEEGEAIINEGNEFKITRLGISVYNFEMFIEELEDLLTL